MLLFIKKKIRFYFVSEESLVEKIRFLVEEVPAYTHSENSLVHRIVRGEEVVLVALTCIQMAHHHEEAGVLDVNIGIGIDDRVVAHLQCLCQC